MINVSVFRPTIPIRGVARIDIASDTDAHDDIKTIYGGPNAKYADAFFRDGMQPRKVLGLEDAPSEVLTIYAA